MRHKNQIGETLKIDTLPRAIPGLSAAEVSALQEVVALAEDLSLRGDERAGVAMDWARDLLATAARRSE